LDVVRQEGEDGREAHRGQQLGDEHHAQGALPPRFHLRLTACRLPPPSVPRGSTRPAGREPSYNRSAGPPVPAPGWVAWGMPLTDAQVLARCPVFAELPDEDLHALAAVGHRVRLEAGETLFLAGEEALGLHVVVSGRVRVYVISPASGREVVLTMEHPYNA